MTGNAPPMLRRAAAQDSPVLTAIAMAAKAYWGYDADFMEACRPELTITPARIRAEHMVIAECGGQAAGFYAFSHGAAPGTGEVEDVFVLPDFMGSGVGRALMDDLKSAARRCGLHRLEVDADPNACAFYERMGFRLTGSSPSASIPGRRLPRLQLALADAGN